MYRPPHFAPRSDAETRELVRAHPLATLVVQTNDGLIANPLPMLMEETRLIGHIARANTLWQSTATGDALAIFHGPDAYVSPNSYASKSTNPAVVPTWNYATVHIHGSLRFFDERSRLHDVVTRLTNVHERTQIHPWRVTDAPAPFIEQLLAQIIGVEVEIKRVEAKFKLSQNRQMSDQASASAALREGHPHLAELMQPLV